MAQELATPAANTPAVRSFSMDQMALLWLEAKMRLARIKEDEKWLDEFKDGLKRLSSNAEEFTLGGDTVAQLRLGQLNESRLAKELPQVHEQYMRVVAKHQFDRDAFAKEQPDLFREYRARRFCVTGE